MTFAQGEKIKSGYNSTAAQPFVQISSLTWSETRKRQWKSITLENNVIVMAKVIGGHGHNRLLKPEAESAIVKPISAQGKLHKRSWLVDRGSTSRAK